MYFFVYVQEFNTQAVENQNNASNFNFSIFFGKNVNLVFEFERSRLLSTSQ